MSPMSILELDLDLILAIWLKKYDFSHSIFECVSC